MKKGDVFLTKEGILWGYSKVGDELIKCVITPPGLIVSGEIAESNSTYLGNRREGLNFAETVLRVYYPQVLE